MNFVLLLWNPTWQIKLLSVVASVFKMLSTVRPCACGDTEVIYTFFFLLITRGQLSERPKEGSDKGSGDPYLQVPYCLRNSLVLGL